MTLKTLPLALAMALGLPALAQAEAPAEAPSANSGSRVLVEVNGEPVQENHFLVYRAQRGGRGKPMDQQTQLSLLNELVNTVILAQDAAGKGLEKDPEVKSAMDVARYRILAEVALQQYLEQHPVTDQDIEAAYKTEFADAKRTEYKASHILLKTEDEAKAVIAELDKGADFAELAKQKSTGPSGPKGGDLGWFEAGQMVKPFSDAVAGMDKGSHSKTPVQTQFGWHVIKLEDTRPQTPPKLDEVHDQLEQELQRARVTEYVNDIRAKANVEIMAPKTKPAEAPAKP